jgi:hypothetical protein
MDTLTDAYNKDTIVGIDCNRLGFIRAGIKEGGLWLCTWNIFEGKIRVRAGSGQSVFGMGLVKF